MPVPNTIDDLSTTESANSPQGTETAKGVIDNYFRRHASFIAQLRDAQSSATARTSGYVSVLEAPYNAKGDGTTDDTAAIQAAINSGKPVDFGDASKVYLVTSTITRTGRVVLRFNGATIKHAMTVQPFRFTDANGSRVYNPRFAPSTVPYTLKRNTSTWVNVVGDVVQSLEGYLPSGQDADLWPTLSAPIKAQFDGFVPGGIKFDVSSVAGGHDVVVSGVTGYQACITLEGYSDSTVELCNFGGHREGIYFYNGLGSSTGAFTLPRGVNNKAVGNVVRYAAQCGIVFFGNDYFAATGNMTYWNGESGIKTYQHDPSTGTGTMCANGVIEGNHVFENYYDGIDATNVNGIDTPGSYDSAHTVVGNRCHNNRHTGITICGRHNNVTANTVTGNGSHGINMQGKNGVISANSCQNNAAHPELHPFQVFDLAIQGDGLSSIGNYIDNPSAPSTYNYLHTGTNGTDPSASQEGIDIGNRCSGGITKMYVSPTIPSAENMLVGAGSRALTDSAIAVYRQGGGGVDLGGKSNVGTVRVRGDAATGGAQIDFTANNADPSTGAFGARIVYSFASDTISMGITGGAWRVYLQAGVGFFASHDNALQLGDPSLRWKNVYATNVTLKPPASVTPANNGEMTFQLTSDTSLTVKVKGSDGVVRSASLTLA